MITIQISDHELGVEYADADPWRSYHLTASGSKLDDIIDDASISEVDQDGGEIVTYALLESPSAVYAAAQKLIEYTLDQAHRNAREAARDYAVDQAIDERKGS